MSAIWQAELDALMDDLLNTHTSRAANALRAFVVPRMSALAELELGDGVYYVTQESAFAPGVSGQWPEVIPAPHTPHGRLVKRVLSRKEP